MSRTKPQDNFLSRWILLLIDGLSSFVFSASAAKNILSMDDVQLSLAQREVMMMFMDGEIKDLMPTAVISDNYNAISFQGRQVQMLWRAEMRDYFGRDQVKLLFN